MRILVLFLLSIQVLSGQNHYTLSGHVDPAINVEIAYLYYPEGKDFKIDSCSVKNNQFEFKGTIEYPIMSTIELKGRIDGSQTRPSLNTINFYIENSDISINYVENFVEIKNSKTQDLQNEFLKLLIPIQNKMDEVQSIFQKRSQAQSITKQFQDSIDFEVKKINRMNSDIISQFIEAHPNDFISLYLLEALIDNSPDSANAIALFSSFSPQLRESTLGLEIASKLNKIKNTSLGSVASDFDIKDINGNTVRLSDLKGKYVLLMFWSSNCSHCLDEIVHIKEIYNSFKNNNFVILAIAQDNIQREKEWAKFVKENQLQWINAFDERVNGNKKLASLYNITKIPSNFLLNRNGQIIAKDIYGDNLRTQLNIISQQATNKTNK